jgi:hypothetical protein
VTDRNYTLTSSDLESAEVRNGTNNNSSIRVGDESLSSSKEISVTTAKVGKWKADNFERDYQLLQAALARHNSLSNLQQLQRKYLLDHGFTKRPLFRDVLSAICNIGSWTAILVACNKVVAAGGSTAPLFRKSCMLFTKIMISMTTLHYWFVVMSLPLFLLAWMKSEEKYTVGANFIQQYSQTKRGLIQKLIGCFSPTALVLDAYFKDPQRQTVPSFFYSTDSIRIFKRKDTSDFVLCLLENWCSAVIASFIWCVLSTWSMPALDRRTQQLGLSIGKFCNTAANTQFLPTLSRLVTRVGVVASLHQYPSLLFELRRNDQPRPLCRSTSILQWSVKNLFRWMPLCISSDLALLRSWSFVTKQPADMSSLLTGFCFSVIGPVSHIIGLAKLIRISKSNDLSLSRATSFPSSDCITCEETETYIDNQHQIKWRYQILWRTPQRISQTLRAWMAYLVTNHKPLLFELDEWKSVIRTDGFSTEGVQFHKNPAHDELLAHSEEIIESLSLIFRDREAAILNATHARLSKHQKSYESKELDDVLGVAVQQTFGLGLSYDFDHFDTPANEKDVSIHQLRARMAKSAILEKKKLDNTLSDELALLHRLRENVSTGKNDEVADREMETVEQEIRDRHNKKIARIKAALMTMIPTNAGSPDGTDKFDSPILVGEYVNLTAPVEQRELKASILPTPDPLLAIEDYTRRTFGDEAAAAYRENELAFRRKERELLDDIRKRNEKQEDEPTEEVDNASNDRELS